jgi:hypothetical protein
MSSVDIDQVAKGLEQTISRIDSEIENLGKKKEGPFYAQLMLSRGRAMKDLSMISQNSEELLGYAIGSLTEAVNIFNKLRDDENSARAHYELGLAYQRLAEIKDHQRNMDIAIRAFDEAKEYLLYEDDPDLYRKIDERLKDAWKEY